MAADADDFSWPPNGKEGWDTFLVLLRQVVESCWRKWQPRPVHDVAGKSRALGDIDDFFNDLAFKLVTEKDELSFTKRAAVYAYVNTAVQHICITRSRVERRYQKLCNQIRDNPRPPEGDEEGRIDEYVEMLSDPVERQVIRLRYGLGMSLPEIGRELGMTLAQVQRAHSRAKTKLKARLRRDSNA